ncbi:uncharacterized protein KZ484_016051 isoform 2-T2 [Pholidichthys leucotaenia]
MSRGISFHSVHFRPSDINTTLCKAQLREGVVPTQFDFPKKWKATSAPTRLAWLSAAAAAAARLPMRKDKHSNHQNNNTDHNNNSYKSLQAAVAKDHTYHLDPLTDLKAKILQLLDENERLRRDLRNCTARERRMKDSCRNLEKELAKLQNKFKFVKEDPDGG